MSKLSMDIKTKTDIGPLKRLRAFLLSTGKKGKKSANEIKQGFANATNKIKESGTEGKKAGSSISGGFLKATATIASFVAGLKSAQVVYKQLIEQPLNEARFMQTALLRMEAFTGSAEEAQVRMSRLATFADSTPFELTNLVKAEQQLLTYGGSALATAENLTMVGDAAAFVGAPIDNLTMWMGRAYALLQEGKPIGEVNLRLSELGLAVPGTAAKIEELQARGASFADTWGLFASQFDRTAGSMAKLSQTADGQISTLNDKIAQFKRTIGESGPLQAFQLVMTKIISSMDSLNKESDLAVRIGIAITKGFFSIIQGGLALQRMWIRLKNHIQDAMGAAILRFGEAKLGWKSFQEDMLKGAKKIAETVKNMVLKLTKPLAKLLEFFDITSPMANLEAALDSVTDLYDISLSEVADDIKEIIKENNLWKESVEAVRDAQEKANLEDIVANLKLQKKVEEALNKVLKEVVDNQKKRAAASKKVAEGVKQETDQSEKLTKVHKDLLKKYKDLEIAQQIQIEHFGKGDTVIKAYIDLLKLGDNATESFRQRLLKLARSIDDKIKTTEATKEIRQLTEHYDQLTQEMGLNEEQLFDLAIAKARANKVSEDEIAFLLLAKDAYELKRDAMKQSQDAMLEWADSFQNILLTALQGGENSFANFMESLVSLWKDGIEQFAANPDLFGSSGLANLIFGDGAKSVVRALEGFSQILSVNSQFGSGSPEASINGILTGASTGQAIGGKGPWGAVLGAVIGAFAGGFFTGGEWEEVGQELAFEITNGLLGNLTLTSLQQRDAPFLGLFGGGSREVEQAVPDRLRQSLIAAYEAIVSDVKRLAEAAGLSGVDAFLSTFNRNLELDLTGVAPEQVDTVIAEFFRSIESSIAFGIVPLAQLFQKPFEDMTDTLVRLANVVPQANRGIDLLGINVDDHLVDIVERMIDTLRDSFVNGNLDLSLLGDASGQGDGDLIGNTPIGIQNIINELLEDFEESLNMEDVIAAARLRFRELFVEALGGAEEAAVKFDNIAATFTSSSELLNTGLEDQLLEFRALLESNLSDLDISVGELFNQDTSQLTIEQLALLTEAQNRLALIMDLERQLANVRGEALQVGSLTVDQLEAVTASTNAFNSSLLSLRSGITFTEQDFLDFANQLGQDFQSQISDFYGRFGGNTFSGDFLDAEALLADFGLSVRDVLDSQGGILITEFERLFNEGNLEAAARVISELSGVSEFLIENLTVLSNSLDSLGISIGTIDIDEFISAFGEGDLFTSLLDQFNRMFPDLSDVDNTPLVDAFNSINLSLEEAVASSGSTLRAALVEAISAGNFEQALNILQNMGPELQEYITALEREQEIKERLIVTQNEINSVLEAGIGASPVDEDTIRALAESLGVDVNQAAQILLQTLNETVTAAQSLDIARATIERYGFSVDEFVQGGEDHYQALIAMAIGMGESGAGLLANLIRIRGAVSTLNGDTIQLEDSLIGATDETRELSNAMAALASRIASAVDNVNAAMARISSATARTTGSTASLNSRISSLYAGLGASISEDINAINQLTALIEERFNMESQAIQASAQQMADIHNLRNSQEIERLKIIHDEKVRIYQEELAHYERLRSNLESLNRFVDNLFISDAAGILPAEQLVNVQNQISGLLPGVLAGTGDAGQLTSLLSRLLELSGQVGGSALRADALTQILDIQQQMATALESAPVPDDPGALHLPEIHKATAGTFLNTERLTEIESAALQELDDLARQLAALEEERKLAEEEQARLLEERYQEGVERETALVDNAETTAQGTIKVADTVLAQRHLLQEQVGALHNVSASLGLGFESLKSAININTKVLAEKQFEPPFVAVTVNIEAPEDDGEGDLE